MKNKQCLKLGKFDKVFESFTYEKLYKIVASAHTDKVTRDKNLQKKLQLTYYTLNLLTIFLRLCAILVRL